MLYVKTRLLPSPIHGIGLFAAEFLPANTIIWRRELTIDISLTEKQMSELSPPCREQIWAYSYKQKRSGLYVLCGDDARFFNHAPNPSCADIRGIDGSGITISARDIQAGEELTCDYSLIDQDYIDGKYTL